MREFAPGLMQLGIEPAEVWYTIFGNGPQMLTIGEVNSLEKIHAILQSSEWKKLHGKLLLYVTNYAQRVVSQNSRTFQIKKTSYNAERIYLAEEGERAEEGEE